MSFSASMKSSSEKREAPKQMPVPTAMPTMQGAPMQGAPMDHPVPGGPFATNYGAPMDHPMNVPLSKPYQGMENQPLMGTGYPATSSENSEIAYTYGMPGYTNIIEKSYEPRDAGSIFAPGGRRRMNIVAVVINIILPPVFFCMLLGLVQYKFRYYYPTLTMFLAFLALIVPAIAGIMAWRSRVYERDAYWYNFAALSLFTAWWTSLLIGDISFWYYMQPYYNIQLMNTYATVNPSTDVGQELMDAGRVYFSDGVKLDRMKAYGFMNVDQYCVAPIVSTVSKMETYDLWAYGINCCGVNTGHVQFNCGEYNNPRARSGLRLMRDDQLPFFRLAVQQAEAAYGIKALHPLFFQWLQDPVDEMDSYYLAGMRNHLVSECVFAVFNLFCVLCALVGFSKIGRYL